MKDVKNVQILDDYIPTYTKLNIEKKWFYNCSNQL